MSLKDFIRGVTPDFLLKLNRNRKKKNRNQTLESQNKSGNALTVEQLVEDLKAIGIQKGDTLLVHSSLSRLGYLKDGPKTFIEALLEAVGENGNLLMPTSPNNVYQLNYIQNI